MTKNDLKPARVFEQFAKINQIPRPSKHEEQMIEYLKEFGKSHNLETEVDKTGNVIIRKPATPGFEDREIIILQSHMDMVCDKLVDVDIDFTKDAIQTYIDGEWLKAKGTTLGADDGIGCAIELAILDSDDIEHGPLECVFTRDEETSLTGAMGMKAGFMKGDMLINLDSGDEGQIFISCAGGKTTSARFTFEREAAPEGIKDGKVVCSEKKMPSRRSTKIRLYADEMGRKLTADGSDFIVVVAEITDDNGNVKRLAKDNIMFSISAKSSPSECWA